MIVLQKWKIAKYVKDLCANFKTVAFTDNVYAMSKKCLTTT